MTHGFGPDFRDAIVSIDGRTLLSGSIELHLKTSGWRAHGHHLDPRYNDVVLHVVQTDDAPETRRLDGKIVPTVTLSPLLIVGLRPRGAVDWSLVGGDVCAAELTQRDPNRVKHALWSLGDRRLAAKVARIESRLLDRPPAEILYRELWDGLGYSANREPMQALANRLPLSAIEAVLAIVPAGERLSAARGLLFGVAGFLPISPADAAFARWSPLDITAAEAMWERFGGPWRSTCLRPAEWTRARVRPANHPTLRLSAAAAMVATAGGGLPSRLLQAVRERADLPVLLRSLCVLYGDTLLGPDRATALAANAVIPFALALAEHTGEIELGETAAHAWETLPSGGANEITRRALRQVCGEARLPGLGERGQQGLIQLDQTLCRPRRCFECPVAALVVDGDRNAHEP